MIHEPITVGAGPSGPIQPIAHLAKTPVELTAEYGLTFTAGSDNLGPYESATVTVGDEPYVLLRHDHSPEPGTDLYAPVDRDPVAAAKAFTEALALGEPRWQHPGEQANPYGGNT